jgi:hypothetical protein
VFGLAGVLLGALLTQHLARQTAESTARLAIQGQLEIIRVKEYRDELAKRLAGVLEWADQLPNQYSTWPQYVEKEVTEGRFETLMRVRQRSAQRPTQPPEPP